MMQLGITTGPTLPTARFKTTRESCLSMPVLRGIAGSDDPWFLERNLGFQRRPEGKGEPVFALKALTLAVALAPGRDIARTELTRALWHNNATWSIAAQPDKYDRVLIPGRSSQSASVVVAYGSNLHRAAALMVGRHNDSDGALEVHGVLRVAGPNRNGETEAGRLYVGGRGGRGAVVQYGGSDVYVSRSLRIGYHDDTTASYIVENATLRARQSITLASQESSTADLQVFGGDASVKTNNFLIGGGNSSLVFESDGAGLSPVTVLKQAVLDGTLRAKISSGSPTRNEFRLMNLGSRSRRSGGFRHVIIESPAGRDYELTYAGGDGNDIALRAVAEPLVRFEDWQTDRFADDEPTSVRGPYSDPDGDGIPNIGEYKLARCPMVDEGKLRVRVTSDGRSYVRYTQRTDRDDVEVMPQVSVGGKLWSGRGIRTQVIATFGNTQVVEASVNSENASFRLAFAAQVDRPNILFILVDDMGWADNEMNDPLFCTPTIKQLSEDGVAFTNHYVYPQCTPTRVALLTGCNPGRFGTQANFAGSNRQILPFGTPTLASVLGDAGYETGLIGKWHLGSVPQQNPGFFGFDTSYGSLAGGAGAYDHRYRLGKGDIADTWHRGGRLITGAESAAPYTQGYHITDLLTDDAVRFLNRRREAPFFLLMAFTATHTPLAEEERWFNDPDGRIRSIENPDRRLMAASAYHLDAAIRRIIDALDNTGQRENTLVVFSSDNGGITRTINGGSFPAPDPTLEAGFSSNGHLRGQKSETYEGGIRVPAFVNWPTQLEPRVEDQPLQMSDWFTTLCNMVTDVPESVQPDGIDVWPLIKDETPLGSRDLYFSCGKTWDWFGLRKDRWKIVSSDGGESWELFDLRHDPSEQHDLSAERPNTLNNLIARAEAHQTRELRSYLVSAWIEAPDEVEVGTSLNVKVRFSEPVTAFDQSTIQVVGGYVQSVSGSEKEFEVALGVDAGADQITIELTPGTGQSVREPVRPSDRSSRVVVNVVGGSP